MFALMLVVMDKTWTIRDLYERLADFERDLERAGKSKNTIDTYVGRSTYFLRYLEGKYRPGV